MSSATTQWWSIGPMPASTATALSTTSTAAVAFANGGGRYYLWASGCNAFLLTGISTVGAAAATANSFSVAIPSGQALVLEIPDTVTHFRAITDSGSGTLYWGKVGN